MEQLDSVMGEEPGQSAEQPVVDAPVDIDVTPEAAADDADGESRDPKMVPYAALKEERVKRQERDRALEQMQQQLAQYERLAQAYGSGQAQQAQAVQAEDPYSEDTVYADLPKALKSVEERTLTRIEAERRQERYENSEILARHMHQDYDDMVQHFADMARNNPMLAEQMERHRSPAIFAYEVAKKDLDSQTSVQKQIEAALEKERARLLAKNAPQSISRERGDGMTAGVQHFQQPSLQDIFGR